MTQIANPDIAKGVDDAVTRLVSVSPPDQGHRGVLIKLLLEERKWWLVGALLSGVLHGLVQSVGRFLTLRAAIDSVVDEVGC